MTSLRWGLVVLVAVVAGGGCGAAGVARDAPRACTAIGCGPSVVVELPRLDVGPDERVELEACVDGRCGRSRVVGSGHGNAVVGVDLELGPVTTRGPLHRLRIAITARNDRSLAVASGRMPVSFSYPNGGACEPECRTIRARLLEDLTTLIATDCQICGGAG